MVNCAALTGFLRTNQQRLAIRTRAEIPGNNLRRAYSDSALFYDSLSSQNNRDDEYLDQPFPYNTSVSCPNTPLAKASHFINYHHSPAPVSPDEEAIMNNDNNPIVTAFATSSASFIEFKADVGLSLLDSIVDDVEFASTMSPFSYQRGILSGHQVFHLASRTPIRVSDRNVTELGFPIQSTSREIGTGGGEIRQDWPCIFAPGMETASPPPIKYCKLILKLDSVHRSDCRSHAVVNPGGTGVYIRPITFCSFHKNAGYLRLEDIERYENYHREEAGGPSGEAIHRFNHCVLRFPPPERLIVYKKDKDLMNPDEAHKQGHDSPNPDLRKQDQDQSGHQSSGPQYPKRYCMECAVCIDGRDWYLYRDRVFCSEDCRYNSTLEKVLLRTAEKVVDKGCDPLNPNSAENRNNRGIVIREVGGSNPPDNNANNARSTGINIVDGENTGGGCADGGGGDAIQPTTALMSKNDKGKGILYIC